MSSAAKGDAPTARTAEASFRNPDSEGSMGRSVEQGAKERPILFSGAMVRALLAGTKTQTRRVVTITRRTPGLAACLQPPIANQVRTKAAAELCPYGAPGDRLWVRETFSGPWCMEAQDGMPALPPSKWPKESPIWHWADGEPTHGDWTRPRPSIHMPRWASRITLEITGVRVERLQEISEADAQAEGVVSWAINDPAPQEWGGSLLCVDMYRDLWNAINGAGSWDVNPYVWVLEFKRLASKPEGAA